MNALSYAFLPFGGEKRLDVFTYHKFSFSSLHDARNTGPLKRKRKWYRCLRLLCDIRADGAKSFSDAALYDGAKLV